VRLIVKLPWRTYPGYVDSIGWPGNTEQFSRFLDRYCAKTFMNSVHLDIGPMMGPRVAVEFYFRSSPRTSDYWSYLFELLVDDNACTLEKRLAVTNWWDQSDDAEIQRDLLVKVLYEPGEPIRAKAYLPFSLRSSLVGK
jgi:hypothetical protein